MRTNDKPHLLTLFLAAAALVACSTGTTENSPNAPTADEVAREASEAADTAGRYVSTQFDRYRADMREQVGVIDQRIDGLQRKVATSSAEFGDEAKARWQSTLTTLRRQSEAFERKLDEAVADTEPAMEEVQQGLDRAWTELKAGVQQAEAEFRSQTQESTSDSSG